MNSPSLWQLRIFEAVARLGSMSRAAQEVLRSQPAVTLAILRMEQALNVNLFDRAATGAYLSSTGAFLFPRCREILADAERAVLATGGNANRPPLVTAAGITRAQIRAVVAVHDARSFPGAAASLKTSIASLQRLARQLERFIGANLYRHTATGMVATAAGDQLAGSLKGISQRVEAMVCQIDRRRQQQGTGVTIGVQLLDPNILLSRSLIALSESIGNAKIRIVSDTIDSLFQRVRSHEIDFIFGALNDLDCGAYLTKETICFEDYCVVARRDHPLAERSGLTVERLSQYDWILPPQGSHRHAAFEQIFRDRETPRAPIETHLLSAIRMLLTESDKLSVLSRVEAAAEREAGRLTVLDFPVPGARRAIGFVVGKSRKSNAMQTSIMEALRSAALKAAPDKGGVSPAFSAPRCARVASPARNIGELGHAPGLEDRSKRPDYFQASSAAPA